MTEEVKKSVKSVEAKEESKDIVIPGEYLGEKQGRKIGKDAYYEGEKVFAGVLGIPRVNENEIIVIPLSGVYSPYVGDKVVALIESVEISGWGIDINCPYSAFLPLSEGVSDFVDTDRVDLSRYFDVGDVIFCTISKVTRNKTIRVSMREVGARKLYGGVLIKVNPTKVPRIIGKAGSMIMMIKEKTKCDIYTGQNGIIWIRGDDKAKAIEAIMMIDRQSHISGLTEKIEKFLSENNEQKKQ